MSSSTERYRRKRRKPGFKIGGRRQTPYVRDCDRSYAQASYLWIQRGQAPSRKTLMKALFSFNGAENRKLNFEGPSIGNFEEQAGAGDGEQQENKRTQVAIYIDTKKRFHFVSSEKVFERSGRVASYYLLKSARYSTHLALDEEIELYRLTIEDIKRIAPLPTRQQIADATKTHRVSYLELRFKLGNWKEYLQSKEGQEPDNVIHVERFTRKRNATTGRVEGEWS